jgi:hypothetical protein
MIRPKVTGPKVTCPKVTHAKVTGPKVNRPNRFKIYVTRVASPKFLRNFTKVQTF